MSDFQLSSRKQITLSVRIYHDDGKELKVNKPGFFIS
jgi:hypothetical protein